MLRAPFILLIVYVFYSQNEFGAFWTQKQATVGDTRKTMKTLLPIKYFQKEDNSIKRQCDPRAPIANKEKARCFVYYKKVLEVITHVSVTKYDEKHNKKGFKRK